LQQQKPRPGCFLARGRVAAVRLCEAQPEAPSLRVLQRLLLRRRQQEQCVAGRVDLQMVRHDVVGRWQLRIDAVGVVEPDVLQVAVRVTRYQRTGTLFLISLSGCRRKRPDQTSTGQPRPR
jgi:hypothetical protein